MCLAIPVRVVERNGDDTAIVDLAGIRKEISLALVDGVEVGDYVILHVGYALAKLDPVEAENTLAIFAQAGVVDARSDFTSPFKGEDGRGMGFEAHHGTPSPPLSPPLQGEGWGGDGVRSAPWNPIPTPAPPLEREGSFESPREAQR